MDRKEPMLVHYTDKVLVLYEDKDNQASVREVTEEQAEQLVARGMSFAVVQEPAPTEYNEYSKYSEVPK